MVSQGSRSWAMSKPLAILLVSFFLTIPSTIEGTMNGNDDLTSTSPASSKDEETLFINVPFFIKNPKRQYTENDMLLLNRAFQSFVHDHVEEASGIGVRQRNQEEQQQQQQQREDQQQQGAGRRRKNVRRRQTLSATTPRINKFDSTLAVTKNTTLVLDNSSIIVPALSRCTFYSAKTSSFCYEAKAQYHVMMVKHDNNNDIVGPVENNENNPDYDNTIVQHLLVQATTAAIDDGLLQESLDTTDPNSDVVVLGSRETLSREFFLLQDFTNQLTIQDSFYVINSNEFHSLDRQLVQDALQILVESVMNQLEDKRQQPHQQEHYQQDSSSDDTFYYGKKTVMFEETVEFDNLVPCQRYTSLTSRYPYCESVSYSYKLFVDNNHNNEAPRVLNDEIIMDAYLGATQLAIHSGTLLDIMNEINPLHQMAILQTPPLTTAPKHEFDLSTTAPPTVVSPPSADDDDPKWLPAWLEDSLFWVVICVWIVVVVYMMILFMLLVVSCFKNKNNQNVKDETTNHQPPPPVPAIATHPQHNAAAAAASRNGSASFLDDDFSLDGIPSVDEILNDPRNSDFFASTGTLT